MLKLRKKLLKPVSFWKCNDKAYCSTFKVDFFWCFSCKMVQKRVHYIEIVTLCWCDQGLSVAFRPLNRDNPLNRDATVIFIENFGPHRLSNCRYSFIKLSIFDYQIVVDWQYLEINIQLKEIKSAAFQTRYIFTVAFELHWLRSLKSNTINESLTSKHIRRQG